MLELEPRRHYRRDIDGLRAMAVIPVILFHFGYLQRGYLGVDVFFVISGYLITGLISNELRRGEYSVKQFYIRRIRRIIPLAILVSAVTLAVGVGTMLPDDMENMSQSVIASNFFGNNVLQAITTRNYWDVVNEYKPLMHTWSLGVEEQYYLLYPLLFSLIGARKPLWLLPSLLSITVVSCVLTLAPAFEDYEKFYLLPFRLYELSTGGVVALLLRDRVIRNRLSPALIGALALLLTVKLPMVPNAVLIALTVMLTTGILISDIHSNRMASWILENRLMVGIGMLSFGLYMWHQVVLAYARYFVTQVLTGTHLVAVGALTFCLAAATYRLVEQPFRNRKWIGTRSLLGVLLIAYGLTNGAALYIYVHAGAVRDVPELDIVASQATRGMHAEYNHRINSLDIEFHSVGKKRILVIGNSFARDWANVLLESKYAADIEVSYIAEPAQHRSLRTRANSADVIFYSTPERPEVDSLGIDQQKMFAVGMKNFGTSNGIFYNYRGSGYHSQRTLTQPGSLELNARLRREWGDRYIDYFAKVVDSTNRVPVFTPSGRFISPDCRHLTRAGAKYFAVLFDQEIGRIVRPS